MSRARKHHILERAQPVSEFESEVRQGMDNLAEAARTLARAFCCLAVKVEARNPGEQRELAAILWNDVLSDFRDVPATPEMRTWLSAFLHIDPKTFPKRPYGR
jgi:hypothetical protein